MLRPPQRWAVVAAWLSVIGGLAPVVWRAHMLVWGAGWDLAPEFRADLVHIAYVCGLIVVETLASLAVLGLVQRWGEVWPGWVPWLGGRRIAPVFVVSVATIGALAVTAILAVTGYSLVTLTLQGISNPILQTHGWHRWFMMAHYLPWVLWPIGLWVAIIAYAMRWFGNANGPDKGRGRGAVHHQGLEP